MTTVNKTSIIHTSDEPTYIPDMEAIKNRYNNPLLGYINSHPFHKKWKDFKLEVTDRSLPIELRIVLIEFERKIRDQLIEMWTKEELEKQHSN